MPEPEQSSYSDLIVICGPPRSGTTWLCRELCNVPKAFPFLPECTFLTQQVDLYHRTMHYGDRQRIQAYFNTEENLLDYFRRNVATLIDQAARFNRMDHAEILILKDPNLSLYLADLKDLLPPHKLIVLVRDPRDVLASMKNVTARKKLDWNVRETIDQLKSYYYPIADYQQRLGKDSIIIRYEDLVAGQTDALQDFLQLPILMNGFSDSAKAAMRNNLDSSDPFFSELYLQPTTSKKVGSFAGILNNKEIRDSESLLAGVMRLWRYPPASLRNQVVSAVVRAIRGKASPGEHN